jgi:CSLREA domain-containing protein
MNLRRRVVLTLLAALLALAFPAAASATEYLVNTKADEPDKAPGAPCETNAGVGVCSLRAAIEVANSTPAVADKIFFLSFTGKLSDTISISTPLESITSPLEINGGTCGTAAGPIGPCVGVSGPNGSTAFTVAAESSSIRGLAIATASTGIRVEAKKFTATSDWFGVNLDGGLGAPGTFGIAVSPNADEATIGGSVVGDLRNVFANSTTGLQLRGASKAVVQGNYFGVLPDGVTASPNTRNLVVADSTGPLPDGTPAKDNLIGADVGTAGAETAACDKGCNVFAGTPSGPSVDLVGSEAFEEKAATGPTTISGNFVGLDATGTGELPSTGYGILAGGADHVTIGGPAAGSANYLVGGSEAIFSGSDGDDFLALGNSIGFRANGTAATSPAGKGIYVLALTVTEEPEIDTNDIRVNGEAGIEVRFSIGKIIDNDVEGGVDGILAGVGDGGGLVAGNTVEDSTGTGILLKSGNNEVRDNTVLDSGAAGIAVKPPNGITATTGNLIGGDEEEFENTIEGSAGAAIEIFEEAGEPGSWTEIARNNGSGNGGRFIALKPDANEGVVPPAISAASKTTAEGTGAEENATIRVFRKASADAGELQSFLGETTADASGNWKVTYSVPGGTIVAATQTREPGATSELSTATVPADPSDPCKGALPPAQCAGPTPTPPGPTPDTTAPTARITKAPKAKSTSTTAKFKFNSNEAGSSFECKLDKGKFKKCKSPKTYKKLKVGKHVFKVRAIDKADNVGRPAKRKFTVVS